MNKGIEGYQGSKATWQQPVFQRHKTDENREKQVSRVTTTSHNKIWRDNNDKNGYTNNKQCWKVKREPPHQINGFTKKPILPTKAPQTLNEFIYVNLIQFRQAEKEEDVPLKVFEECIDGCSFYYKIEAIQTLVSALDCRGTKPLSDKYYFVFGNFFFQRILKSACEELFQLALVNPKDASRKLVVIYHSIRFLLNFRYGKLFSEWEDKQDSIAAILISLARKYPLPDIRFKLFEIALKCNSTENFFMHLFLEGRLAGYLTLGSDPHPALDLGAYGYLLLQNDFAIRSCIALKKEADASYIKKSLSSMEYPDELIRLLREQLKTDAKKSLVLEEVIADYAERLHRQTHKQKKLEKKEDEFRGTLDNITKNCLLFTPRSTSPQVSSLASKETDKTESIFNKPTQESWEALADDEEKELPPLIDPPLQPQKLDESKEPLPELTVEEPVADAPYFAERIISGNKEVWPQILEYLEKSIETFSLDTERVFLALVLNQWKEELKQFFKSSFSKIPVTLWTRIVLKEDRKLIVVLKILNFLLDFIDQNTDKALALYLREQVLEHLLSRKVIAYTIEAITLYAQIAEKVFNTFEQLPPAEGSFIRFSVLITLFSQSSTKTISVVELLPILKDKILTFCFSYLRDNFQEVKQQSDRGIILNLIGAHYGTDEQHKLITEVLVKITALFYRTLKQEEVALETINSYHSFLQALVNPRIRELSNRVGKFKWVLTNCWYTAQGNPLYQEGDLGASQRVFQNCLMYPKSSKGKFYHDIVRMGKLHLDHILKNVEFFKASDQTILRNLLLRSHVYKLFDFDLLEILGSLQAKICRMHSTVAVRTICAFSQMRDDDKPLISLEHLSKLTQQLILEGLKHQRAAEILPIAWNEDVKQVSNLFYAQFCATKEKEERLKLESCYQKFLDHIFVIARIIPNVCELLRHLLRVGPSVKFSNYATSLEALIELSKLNLERYPNQALLISDAGLIRGRLAYLYMRKASKAARKGKKLDLLLEGRIAKNIPRFAVLKKQLDEITQNTTPTDQNSKNIKKIKLRDIDKPCEIVELFSCYLANLGMKPQKTPIPIDLGWWTRFTKIPLIQKLSGEMEKQIYQFFKISFEQAYLHFGLALLNCQPNQDSFNESLKILESFKDKVNSHHTHLFLLLYKKMFRFLTSEEGKKLPLEERKKGLIRLIDKEFILSSGILNYQKLDFTHEILSVFETLVKDDSTEAEEISFTLWELAAECHDVIGLKIILDRWSTLALKHGRGYLKEIVLLYKEILHKDEEITFSKHIKIKTIS